MNESNEAHEIENGVLGEFPYSIWENTSGYLCGYLGVPSSHPWYGKDYNSIDCEVHGGLTYCEANIIGHPETLARLRERADPNDYLDEFTDEDTGITFPSLKPFAAIYQRRLNKEIENAGLFSHFPIENFPYDVWWLGFDCGHYMDAPRPGSRMDKLDKAFEAQHPEFDYSHEHDKAYKDRDYVYAELESLASQAAKVAMLDRKGNQ